jgi:hypothetical protein
VRVQRHNAYGLRLAVWFPLAGIPPLPENAPAASELAIRLAGDEPLGLSGEPVSPPYVKCDLDGTHVESALGPAGDHVFTYGAHARFHLSADKSVLRCAPRGDGAAWERGLVGPVLGQISALAGNVVFAGSVLLIPDGAVAMVGHAASVSALAGALRRREHALLSEGVVALRCGASGVAAHPGPAALVVRRDPVPLRAILVLERIAGSASLMAPLHESIPALMDAWIVPHGRLDRAERRASGFEQVVCTTPAYCLLAGADGDPARLAETVTSRCWPRSPLPTSSSRSRTSA